MEKIDNYENIYQYTYGRIENLSVNHTYLKDIPFSFREDISFSMNLYLQGICFANEYLLISGYQEGTDAFGEILVFHRESGILCLTLSMDGNSHLGGIAFDGESIWICNSAEQTIERISYQMLEQWIRYHFRENVLITNLVDGYPVQNTPSSITFFDGKLWVVTHEKWNFSMMCSYRYDSAENAIIWEKEYRIPPKAQGIAFHTDGTVYVSCSYGRRSSSYLRVYRNVNEMSHNINADIAILEMPPCSEGVAILEEQLYLLFESAGKKYFLGTDGFGESLSPLNQILMIDLSAF